MEEKSKEILIWEINHLITAMLEVVLPDFMQLTELLKLSSATIKNANDAVKDSHAQIVKELQYYDILTQKMDHIIQIHDFILKGRTNGIANNNRLNGANLIRLNHLQFQVGCFEYLSSVNHIQTNLSSPGVHRVLRVEPSMDLFQYTGILLSASRNINQKFTLIEKMYLGQASVDLHSCADTISKIYSMESERTILYTYLNKPLIQDQELQHASQIQNTDIDIDLF